MCPYCEASLGARPVDRREPGQILGGLIPQARFTTIIILLINTGLFVGQQIDPQSGLTSAGASVPWPYMQHQLWRLVTAGFLHGGIIHILMNSWVLFDVGAEVEQFYGTSRLLVFYFVSTVCGFYVSSNFGHGYSLGSSAGIFGLMGAMLAFAFTDKSALGSAVRSLYTRWIIFALIMSFIPGVDYWAHIGGIIGGFVTAYLASTPRARAMWKEPVIRAAAAMSLILTCAAFAMMFLYLRAAA